MKKLLAVLLLLCMCCSLFACGGNDTGDTSSTTTTAANTHDVCEPGNDGFCKVCGKATLPLSFYITQPFDTNTEIKEFIDEKYAGSLYVKGNYRLLYTNTNKYHRRWYITICNFL